MSSNHDPELAIRMRGITKTYRKGDTEISPLKNLDLDVPVGGFCALMGPSGSGKSTLLNLVAGIDRATEGRVEVFAEDITEWSEGKLANWRTRMLGYIFQQYNLMPVLTAFENVELPLLLLPLTRAQRREQVMTALDLVGLSDRAQHYPRQLSGGQEQRVAIARCLAADPKIILGDEPTGNLDRESAKTTMNLLKMLNQEFGKTIVIVTHDSKIGDCASRCLHLDKGVLQERGVVEAQA